MLSAYPSLTWNKVDCVVAPNIPYRPRTGAISQTVGDGNDYAAEVTSGLITKTTGSFPKVKGVTSETGLLGANDYSLQLNLNFDETRRPAMAPRTRRSARTGSNSYTRRVMRKPSWSIGQLTTIPAAPVVVQLRRRLLHQQQCRGVCLWVVITEMKYAQAIGFGEEGHCEKVGIDTLVFTAEKVAYSATGIGYRRRSCDRLDGVGVQHNRRWRRFGGIFQHGFVGDGEGRGGE